MKLVDVEMQNIELVGALANLIEHQHIIWDRITNRWCEPKRGFCAGHEFSRGQGVAAGKERDLVTLLDELLRQIGNDALGTSVACRRHTFDRGSNLCDSHKFAFPGAKSSTSASPLRPQRTKPKKAPLKKSNELCRRLWGFNNRHQEDRHRGPHELLLPSCWSRWDIAFRSVCSRCGLAAFPIDSPPENPGSIGSGSGSARAGPAGSAVAPFLHAKGAIALGAKRCDATRRRGWNARNGHRRSRRGGHSRQERL